MAANELERAVIEAARALVSSEPFNLCQKFNLCQNEWVAIDLATAVQTLDAWQATQDPTVKERGWHEVAEGDELRGNNGTFYPVIRTLKVQRGKYEVIVRVDGTPTQLIRPGPHDKNPTAWVRRGAAGAAVDIITHVFASGPDPTE